MHRRQYLMLCLAAGFALLPAARAMAKKLLEKEPVSLALTKSTCNALAESLVPAHITHSDREFLMLSRLLTQERQRQ